MKSSIYIIILILSFLNIQAYGQSYINENKIIDIANYIENKNLPKAKQLAEEVVKSDSLNDAAQAYLGRIYLSIGDFKRGEEHVKKAIKLAPHNYWYKLLLSNFYSYTKQKDKNIPLCEDIIKDNPKMVDIIYELYTLYAEKGQYEKSLDMLNRIESIMGKSAELTIQKYYILSQLNKADQGLQILKDYIKEDPDPEVLCTIAFHEKDILGNYQEAKKYYDEALKINNDMAKAQVGEADLYITQKDYKNYIKMCRKVAANPNVNAQVMNYILKFITDDPNQYIYKEHKEATDSLIDIASNRFVNDSTLNNSFAKYYYIHGQIEKVINVYKNYHLADPQNIRKFTDYLDVLGQFKQYNKVINIILHTDNYQHTPQLMDRLATCYNLNKDYKQAISVCKEIIQHNKKDSSVVSKNLYLIGENYRNLGNDKKAFRYFKKSLKISSSDALILNNVAYYMAIENKNLDLALEYSKKATELAPDNATYLDTYGYLLYKLGKNNAAKSIFKKAIIYGGNKEKTIIEHYILVLKALNENNLADYYQKQIEALDKNEN